MSKIAELYSYRELLQNLVIKELKVKYKSSFLGFFWALLRPVLLGLVYTIVFSIIFQRNEVENFPLFLMAGLLPWTFFAGSMTMSASSIMGNSGLIKKIYFPRELFPLSIILANFFSLLVEMGLLLVFLTVFGYSFWIYLPVVALAFVLLLIMAVGFGFFFASVTIFFPDVKQFLSVIIRGWFFMTPIVYPIERLEQAPEIFRTLLRLNPMHSIVMMFKLSLYYNKFPGTLIFAAAIASSLIIFIIGYSVFNRLSPTFAKEI